MSDSNCNVLVQEYAYIRRGRPRYHSKQRDLINILEKKNIKTKNDFLNFLEISKLPKPFTNTELAENLSIKGGVRRKKKIAGCLTYSLCSLGILERVGKKRIAIIFDIPNSNNIDT